MLTICQTGLIVLALESLWASWLQVDKMNLPGILRADFQDPVEIGRQGLDFLLRQNGSCVEEPVALKPGNLIVGECLHAKGSLACSRLQVKILRPLT